MKRILFFILLAGLAMGTMAQTFSERKSTYKLVEGDGRRVVTGFQQFDGTDEQILANAMTWVIDNLCQKERDAITEVQVQRKSLTFNSGALEFLQTGKVKYTFFAKVNLRVAEGRLVYTVYDIQYKAAGLISSLAFVDRLNPEKKPKQQEIIDACEKVVSKQLNLLFDEVQAARCPEIAHWSDIDIQRPVKGMTMAECKLALGKPETAYEDKGDGRTQWSYGMSPVLFFGTDGTLETIIQ